MKILTLEARAQIQIKLSDQHIAQLQQKIVLFTTVQFLDSLSSIKQQIEATGRIAVIEQPRHTKYPGQILGCCIHQYEGDGFLYIGDGLFHPKALALRNNKPVYCYDPFTEKFSLLDTTEIEQLKKKQKGALLTFHSSTEIGVLVTTKPGQNFQKNALALKKKFPDKHFYFLLSDTVDFTQLENFSFIECFVNTGCPRMSFDDAKRLTKPIVDIGEIDQNLSGFYEQQ